LDDFADEENFSDDWSGDAEEDELRGNDGEEEKKNELD
jgi:hypothetical protein